MKFEQYYLECLSHASYLIGDESSGLAAVVDPRRDVGEYVADAEDAGLTIVYVIETHFHADFLSGHLELAEATGAEIVFGAAAAPEFPVRLVADGERIALGDVVLEFRATPGHTPESTSVVVWEHADDPAPWGVFTGDTLFIGDVGRPDLLASIGVTADELGSMLYDSLRHKLLTLPDATRVWPAHGAGSACGKNISTATVSTIGEQRRDNYALQPMNRDRFVDMVTEGQPAAPDYFVHDAVAEAKVRLGRIGFDGVIGALHDVESTLAARPDAAGRSSRLTANDLAARLADTPGLQVVDVRNPGEVALGAIEGSVNVPLAALRRRVDEIDLEHPVVVHCAGGYRSSIAASWLRSAGARDVSDLLGGYGAWADRQRDTAA